MNKILAEGRPGWSKIAWVGWWRIRNLAEGLWLISFRILAKTGAYKDSNRNQGLSLVK